MTCWTRWRPELADLAVGMSPPGPNGRSWRPSPENQRRSRRRSRCRSLRKTGGTDWPAGRWRIARRTYGPGRGGMARTPRGAEKIGRAGASIDPLGDSIFRISPLTMPKSSAVAGCISTHPPQVTMGHRGRAFPEARAGRRPGRRRTEPSGRPRTADPGRARSAGGGSKE